MSQVNLNDYIRDIPDFPKPGILFKDITPLLTSPLAFDAAISRFAEQYRNRASIVLSPQRHAVSSWCSACTEIASRLRAGTQARQAPLLDS